MRVLTFTSLFPNHEQPNFAVFIKNRMSAVNKYTKADVRVVAPIPWFPKINISIERWKKFAYILSNEKIGKLNVYHPRYLITPKVGMTLYGYSMFIGCKKTVTEIYKEWPFDLIDAHYIFPDGMAAILLGKKLNIPVVVSARGTDMNLYPKINFVRFFIRKVLKQSQRQIAVSMSLADMMIKYGADYRRINVIPNGINPEHFKAIDQKKLGRSFV